MEFINVGTRILNNYVIRLDNGYLLIDTGYCGQFNNFCKRLGRHGIKLKEILYVFLTHTHDDHAGFLEELLSHTDAKVILHPSAVDRLMGESPSQVGGCTNRLGLAVFGFMKLIGNGKHDFPAVDRKERYLLVDDYSKSFIEKEILGTILYLPGHSVDSIGLLYDDFLFCGDAAMNGFPSKNRISIWVENLNEYRASWETMMNLGDVKLHPGHGKPFLVKELKKYFHKTKDIKLYPLP